MNVSLIWLGRLGGFGGALFCAVVLAVRMAGTYSIAGFQVGTLFQFGMAAMIFGCVCFLASLAQPSRK